MDVTVTRHFIEELTSEDLKFALIRNVITDRNDREYHRDVFVRERSSLMFPDVAGSERNVLGS